MKDLPTFKNHLRFDPWNSASTGHQVAPSGSASQRWQSLREQRLAQQFRRETGPRRRPSGEWTVIDTNAEREVGQRDIRSMFGVSKAGVSTSASSSIEADGLKGGVKFKSSVGVVSSEPRGDLGIPSGRSISPTQKDLDGNINNTSNDTDTTNKEKSNSETTTTIPPTNTNSPKERPPEKDIFRGTTIYLNCPSHPLLSDHKLKHLLATHGAVLSLSLSRRVSHVLVGKPNGGPGRGTGGGLAAGKLQKEISRAGCRAVKVVFVEWVIESIRAGRRLPESRFAMHVAPQGQKGLPWGSR